MARARQRIVGRIATWAPAMVLVLLAFAAAPAHATITNVQALNGAQDPILGDTVPDTEEIWAYVTSPTGGVVCIHRAVAHPGGCQDGGAYSKTLVPPLFAGFVPVAAGRLVSGEWMLVAAEASGSPATAASAEFFVEPCPNCAAPPLNKANDFIAAAQQVANDVNTVCGLMKTASMLWRSRKMYELASDAVTIGPGGMNMGTVVVFTIAAHEAYEDVENGDDLTAKLPGALGSIADHLCDAAEKLAKAPSDAAGYWMSGWAADPPDPNFNTVTPPTFTDFSSIVGFRDYGFLSQRQDMDAVRAYAEGSLHAYERFQGATNASNADKAHNQARVMGADLLEWPATLRNSAAFLHQTAAQARSEFPDPVDRTVTQGDLDTANEVLDRIRTTGYTAGEITRLHAAGFDDTAIARLKVDLSLYDPSNVAPAALDAKLDQLAGSLLVLADEAESFGRDAAVVAGRTNRPLGADYFTSLEGADKLDADFVDNSTNPGGDPLGVQWDFGDGTTGDGRHVNHHYAAKGTFTVTETVSTDYTSDSSTKQVDVGTPNAHPVASFTATPGSGTAPLMVHFDASASSDDGSIGSYAWSFGDGSPDDTGVQADHTFQEADPDGYAVTLTVTDDQGATTATKKTIAVAKPPLPPTPQDDSLEASPAGVIDALANDSDPNGDHITVVATGAPAHGTATCSPLGACTYTAQAGYEGSDAFTYTVHDPGGLEATATVNVTVSGPPVATEPLPTDDDLVVGAGTAGNIDALANDDGKPSLALVSATDPPHGTASCGADGQCTYTPNPGFTGHDGFEYTMQDGTATQSTAEVHVTVLAAGAAYSVGVAGAPDPLAAGDEASWSIGVADAAPQAPQVTYSLSGAHTVVPGSVHTAPRWTATGTGADAGPTALLGDSLSVPLTKPAAVVSQPVGGDGFVPILVGDRVFTIYHITNPSSVSCIDRRTNRRCPGYPIPIAVGAGSVPGPAVVVGTRFYQRVDTAPSYSQSAAAALFCWDTATTRPCGLTIVARLHRTSNVEGSAPVLIAGKLWFAMGNGKLYCVDPATNAACGSIDTGLDEETQLFDVLAHGTKVFLAQASGTVGCVDVALAGPCLGWTFPRIVASGGANLINRHGADGSVTGICLASGPAARCWPDSGTGTGTVVDGFPQNGGIFDISQEAEVGTRTLMAYWPGGGVLCFDWATQEKCSGGGYSADPPDGHLTKDVFGDTLPTTYGIAFDGSCAVALGDEGLLFTFDTSGFAPCSGLAGNNAIDLRDQRCDGSVGAATWTSAALEDAAAGELGGVRVTVRDAVSGDALGSKNLINGTLDLSGIDAQAHPAITLAIAVTAHPSSVAWDDHVPPRVLVKWHADPRQLCFHTTTPAACHADPIGVHAAVGSASGDAVLAVTPQTCPPPPVTETTSPATTPTPPSPPPTATDLILRCSTRRVVLEDVYLDHGRVRLVGVADTRLAGKKVEFVLSSTGKVVASAVVGSDGAFAASAAQPPPKLRRSNKTRYLARVGTERSINLKLVRRMIVTSVKAIGGKVTIAGRVIPPLALKPADRKITLQRSVDCTKVEKVAAFAPHANGAFSVTVPVIAGQQAAVYRLATKVRVSARSKTLAPTFTLPRAVQFG